MAMSRNQQFIHKLQLLLADKKYIALENVELGKFCEHTKMGWQTLCLWTGHDGEPEQFSGPNIFAPDWLHEMLANFKPSVEPEPQPDSVETPTTAPVTPNEQVENVEQVSELIDEPVENSPQPVPAPAPAPEPITTETIPTEQIITQPEEPAPISTPTPSPVSDPAPTPAPQPTPAPVETPTVPNAQEVKLAEKIISDLLKQGN